MGNRKKKKTAKRLTSHKCDWKDFPVEIIDAGRAFGSLEARPASGTEGREEHHEGLARQRRSTSPTAEPLQVAIGYHDWKATEDTRDGSQQQLQKLLGDLSIY